jgi:hypothetical protein
MTGQDVIDRALSRSEQNEAGLISTADMVSIVSDTQKAMFLLAAQEAPNFFGTESNTSARSAYTDSWDISALGVGVVTRVEVAAIAGTPTVVVGDEVKLVDVRFPELEPTPRAYIRDQRVYGYGTDLGSADANMATSLKVLYSKVPGSMTDEDTVLTLPDRWVDLLVVPLARKLALADGGRVQEVQSLEAEMAQEVARFVTAIKVYDYTTVRPATAQSPLQILGIPKQEG